ncbi:hypothetical protein ACJJTC_018063 [Scirpophaga incertulas]
MSDWGCCQGNIKSKEKINCSKCNKKFHWDCLRLGDADFDANAAGPEWMCPLCKNTGTKSVRKDTTPIRASANVATRSSKRPALSSPPSNVSVSLSQDDVRQIIRSEFADMITLMKSTLSDFTSELKTIREDINDVKESMGFMNSKFEEINKEMSLTSDTVKTLKCENDYLKSTIINLSNRVNQLEQHSRASNIEIQCVPERNNENLLTMVKQLGSIIGHQVNNEEISHCTRIAKLDRNSNRPRSIIVKFNTQHTRDGFLAAVFKYNKSHSNEKIKSSHMGLAEFVGYFYLILSLFIKAILVIIT